ncbi:MAG TPA: CaiB/BaiF CoA-transferase family protein [Terriglobales bacterium]|nr:CaiB/BaiF CoA-transferase family protein [Terriglobales bacterium]
MPIARRQRSFVPNKIVVLDLTRLLPGAMATKVLCDYGATVIKIEEPQHGDPARRFPNDKRQLLFKVTNAGKFSVTLDLKSNEGKQVFARLATKSDIVIEGFRPGVMDRLGIGFGALSRRNSRLVYVSLSGYGRSGPYHALPGHDLNYGGLAGLLQRDLDRRPVVPQVPLVDIVGGLLTAIRVLFALTGLHPRDTAQRVDLNLYGTARWLVPIVSAIYHSGVLSGNYACYRAYKAKDDGWLTVAALERKFWENLCNKINCADLIDLQFASDKQGAMIQRLSTIFRKKYAAEWFTLLGDECVAPVMNDIWRSQQARRPPVKGELGCGAVGKKRPRECPSLGQHTRHVLSWAGYSKSAIDSLEAHRIIRTPGAEW